MVEPNTSAEAEAAGRVTGTHEEVRIPVAGFPALSGELHRSQSHTGPALLWLPAMGVPAGYYRPFAAALAARGVTTLVADLRGQGNSGPPGGQAEGHGYAHLVEVDCPAAMAVLREAAGSAPLLVGGHSLGGHVAVLHAGGASHKPDGVVLIAAQNPHYRAYPGLNRARMLLGTQFIGAVARILGHWPGDKLGFGGRQPKPLIQDWARLCRTGRWNLAGTEIDYQTTLAATRLPVLAVTIEGDPDAPPGSVERLCADLPRAAITRWTCVPESPAVGGHLRWARGSAQAIAGYVTGWLSQSIARKS